MEEIPEEAHNDLYKQKTLQSNYDRLQSVRRQGTAKSSAQSKVIVNYDASSSVSINIRLVDVLTKIRVSII